MKKAAQKYIRHHVEDIITLIKMLLVAVQILIFVVGWDLMQSKIRYYAETSFLLYVIYALILFWMHQTYKSMRIGSSKQINLITAQFLSLLISDCMLLLLSTLAIRTLPNLWIFLSVFVLQVTISVLWCKWANKIFYQLTPPKRTAIVYGNEEDRSAFDVVFQHTNKYHVDKVIFIKNYSKPYDDLLEALSDAESIFLANVPSDVRSLLYRFSTNHNLSINLCPTLDDIMVTTAKCRFIANIPILKVHFNIAPLPVRIIKRSIDIFFSGLLLICASPIMATVAILIWAEDHGSIIYRQKRLTIGGKVFEILKFRSMRMDAEKDGVARLASEKDDRITKIGRIIRSTRLDELPQLWNVFKGDMSLVGPRPERPEIAQQYLADLPEFNARLRVKAGLTGYAQVNGKYNTTPKDKLQMDLMYISDMSIPLDIKLILQTIHIMLKKESTEGIEEGTTTAKKNHSVKPPA